MKMKKVYLCGPITGASYETAVEGWRKTAASYLIDVGAEPLSPMRGKYHLKGLPALPDEDASDATSQAKGIVGRDRNDVRSCDVVLAYLLDAPRVSIGSMVEYGWADAYRKPVVTVLRPGELHDHSFIRELSTYVVPTLYEALDLTAMLLNLPRRASTYEEHHGFESNPMSLAAAIGG